MLHPWTTFLVFTLVLGGLGVTHCWSQQTEETSSITILSNGSFEVPKPGMATIPDGWSVRFADRGDDVRRVVDLDTAHRGQAFVDLTSNGGPGVILDALPPGGIQLEPGESYEVSLWAKAKGGTSPTLRIEPGSAQRQLSDQWQRYRVPYTLPADARRDLGFFIQVSGGRASIDDVSFVPAGMQVTWPSELDADRTGLADQQVQSDWRAVDGEPGWTQRTVIRISEVLGKEAEDVPIRFRVCDVLPGMRYDKISPRSLKVADGHIGHVVPFALADGDSFAGPSAMDELVIRVSCPPSSRTSYFVYYRAVTPKPDEKWPAELPALMLSPGEYRGRLDVNIDEVELPLHVEVSCDAEIQQLEVKAFLAGTVDARLVTPAGKVLQTWQIGTSNGSFQAKSDLSLPENAAEGVWQAVVSVKRTDTNTVEELSKPFIHGDAMWWANNADTLDPIRRGPRAGTDWIEIAAARNERESFQLAIASCTGRRNVVLKASDLRHADSDEVIGADSFEFQFVEQVHIAMPHPRGAPAGWYGDPLVPWRKRHVAASGFAHAWVTVQVDHDTPPGDYWGEITDTGDQGHKLVLPIRLRVFDFSLPEDLAMKAILGGDIWMKATKGYHPRSARRNPYHDIHDGATALVLARLLADHHATPFYYHHDKCPYAVPWHYDPETGSAEFDFSQLDRNADVMLNKWGQDIFFLAASSQPGSGDRERYTIGTAIWIRPDTRCGKKPGPSTACRGIRPQASECTKRIVAASADTSRKKAGSTPGRWVGRRPGAGNAPCSPVGLAGTSQA